MVFFYIDDCFRPRQVAAQSDTHLSVSPVCLHKARLLGVCPPNPLQQVVNTTDAESTERIPLIAAPMRSPHVLAAALARAVVMEHLLCHIGDGTMVTIWRDIGAQDIMRGAWLMLWLIDGWLLGIAHCLGACL